MTPRPMSPSQVADLFGVSVETVGAWADAGKLPSFRTPGGHRRFHRADVDALLAPTPTPDTTAVES